MNELDWHARHRNHDTDTKWYQVYYKVWRFKHPDYQQQYRRQLTDAIKARIQQSKQRLKQLLKDFQAFQEQRRKQFAEQEQRLIAAIRAQRTGQLAINPG